MCPYEGGRRSTVVARRERKRERANPNRAETIIPSRPSSPPLLSSLRPSGRSKEAPSPCPQSLSLSSLVSTRPLVNFTPPCPPPFHPLGPFSFYLFSLLSLSPLSYSHILDLSSIILLPSHFHFSTPSTPPLRPCRPDDSLFDSRPACRNHLLASRLPPLYPSSLRPFKYPSPQTCQTSISPFTPV